MEDLFSGMQTNSSTANKATGGLDFRGIFTGETFMTPFIFNPTKEEFKKTRGFKDDAKIEDIEYKKEFDVRDENGTVIKKRKAIQVSLHCRFNPNEMLSIKDREAHKFADKYYHVINFLISSELVTSSKGSALVIDGKLHSAWIPMNLTELNELYRDYRVAKHKNDTDKMANTKSTLDLFVQRAVRDYCAGKPDVNYGAVTLDVQSCRVAREGEEILQKMIFDMSDIKFVPYKTKAEHLELSKKASEEKVKDGEKNSYQQYVENYKTFNLTSTAGLFDLFLAERYSEINEMIFQKNVGAFTNQGTGKPCKIGVFLTARHAENGNVYQGSFRPNGKFGSDYTFRKPYENYAPKVKENYKSFGPTVMPTSMIKAILNPENKFQEVHQGKFAFQPYDVAGAALNSDTPAVASPKERHESRSRFSDTDRGNEQSAAESFDMLEAPTVKKQQVTKVEDDDLPF